MSADCYARGIAIAGAAIAAANFGWSVLSWRRNGPDVKITAIYWKESQRGEPQEVHVTVSNEGRLDVQLVGLCATWTEHRMTFRTDQFEPTVLPTKLEANHELDFKLSSDLLLERIWDT